VGDQEIAVGEAVKVGDKFGLWVTSIAMPGERFWVLQGERAK
jgi:flagellar motor switch protein FliN/FliY